MKFLPLLPFLVSAIAASIVPTTVNASTFQSHQSGILKLECALIPKRSDVDLYRVTFMAVQANPNVAWEIRPVQQVIDPTCTTATAIISDEAVYIDDINDTFFNVTFNRTNNPVSIGGSTNVYSLTPVVK